MKKMIIVWMMFSLLLSLGAVAQGPGDSRPLAEKSSSQGKRELRKESRVKSNDRKHNKKLEKDARKKAKKSMGTRLHKQTVKSKRALRKTKKETIQRKD